MPEWVWPVAGYAVTGLGILIGFVKQSTRQEEHAKSMVLQHASLKTDIEKRFDKQDDNIENINDTLTGVRLDVQRIKGKLDMNGNGHA
jgi:hypothetical protein